MSLCASLCALRMYFVSVCVCVCVHLCVPVGLQPRYVCIVLNYNLQHILVCLQEIYHFLCVCCVSFEEPILCPHRCFFCCCEQTNDAIVTSHTNCSWTCMDISVLAFCNSFLVLFFFFCLFVWFGLLFLLYKEKRDRQKGV